MQPAEKAEDELSQQLSAWESETEGGDQLAMGSHAAEARPGRLNYDASALSISLHAWPSAPSLYGLSDSDMDEIVDDDPDFNAANSGWLRKNSGYKAVATAPDQEISTTKEVVQEEQANETIPPIGNNVFPPPYGRGGSSDDEDSVAAAAGNSVKGETITGPRVALNQGMKRLLDRVHNTRSAMRRGVMRVREMVGSAYRHARYNNALTGRDKEVSEPLLDYDSSTEQEYRATRTLKEFVKAEHSLFK